jgi:ABC-2 type transport system ATP-binding protein
MEYPMIKTVALTKRYGPVSAVEELSLEVHAGEIYGFLGPNGSGKTTTMRMLLGGVKQTSGEIFLFGQRFDRNMLSVRARIGLVPERHPEAWSWMTGLEYLLLFSDLFGVPEARRRAGDLMDRVGLSDAANRRVAGYSHGMLQRLNIARALLHDPPLLFLDEPTGGLDAIGIKQMRDLILEENRSGRTIFVSSHLLSEMERICHRIAIIYKGHLLAEDRTSALLSRFAPDREIQIELESIPAGLVAEVETLPFVLSASGVERSLRVRVDRSGDHRRELSELLIHRGLVPLRIDERETTLEEAFITITKDNVEQLAGAKR